MNIVGLSGYARSGKDETARVLIENHGYHRIAFADKLREVLYQLNPLVSPIEKNYFVSSVEPVRLQWVIDTYGWSGYKETWFSDEIRVLLQRLGTEAGRQTLWDSIWVDAAFAGLDPHGSYVITDCRFPNEAAAVSERGGKIWRVSRPGVGAANAHASETSLDDYNFLVYLNNDGDLKDLEFKVNKIMETV